MSDLWLRKFKQRVVPQIIKEFRPEKILIFGSRVGGQAKEGSDIDVIIVSDFFINIRFVKRMPLILKKVRFEKHIDFLCYTAAEFQRIKTTSSVVIDALENGEFIDS